MFFNKRLNPGLGIFVNTIFISFKLNFRYAEDFRRLVDEITIIAEMSRKTRTKIVDDFHNIIRRLINDGVDDSRR